MTNALTKRPARRPLYSLHCLRRLRSPPLRATRGAAMTEYAVIVGFVALVSMGAFIALGVALVNNFEARRDLLLYPSP